MNSTAILLMNLGSPDAPTAKDLKPYLNEFLMDERVIDIPWLLRSVVVKGFIVPFRAPKSAEKYQSIWTKEGSPLVVHTKNLTGLVSQRFNQPVYFSMRYGKPSSRDTIRRIHDENPGLKTLILFPLYPHYAMSSYETAVQQVKEIYQLEQYSSELRIVPPCFDDPHYIRALSESIRPYVEDDADHFLFSYHGIPERHVKKTDPTKSHCLVNLECCSVTSPAHAFCYRHQIIKTTNNVAAELGLDKRRYSFSFQSRLGNDAWLKPYTVTQLKAFPQRGIKRLVVICPAFVSDCLETLEEIEVEGKELFLESGGESFVMVPALNESPAWLDTVEMLIRREMFGVVTA